MNNADVMQAIDRLRRNTRDVALLDILDRAQSTLVKGPIVIERPTKSLPDCPKCATLRGQNTQAKRRYRAKLQRDVSNHK